MLMKTLTSKNNIKIIIAQLDGYLQALRDLNDDHIQKRYWFNADLLKIKNRKVAKTIEAYLKEKDVSIHKITIKEELDIIQSFITDNYLLGTSNPNNQAEQYIKYLQAWRVQEYITLVIDDEHNVKRWKVNRQLTANCMNTVLFTKIKNKLIVMSFFKENRAINT